MMKSLNLRFKPYWKLLLREEHIRTKMFFGSRQVFTLNRLFKISGRNKSAHLKQSVQDFENYFPKVLDKISKLSVPEVVENVKRIVEYSANEENKIRGTIALMAYESLRNPDSIIDRSLNNIKILAWGAEMVETYFKMLKDIEENPLNCCWHIHDPSLLRSFINKMLEYDFMGKPYYMDFTQVFEQAFFKSTVGHILDTTSRYRSGVENFHLDRYNSIVEYSTSYPVFKFPISLANNLLGKSNGKNAKEVDSICSELGKLYHLKMDFQDCYGEETDQFGVPNHSRQIHEGKCTWLAIIALQRLTPTQKVVFSSCYGSKQPAHIERLKLLYDQIHMKQACKEEQEKICDAIERKEVNLDEAESKLIYGILDLVKNN